MVHPNTLLALSAGIQSEVAAYVFYKEAMKVIDDTELKPIIEKLAYEEKEHFQQLESRHHRLMVSEKWVSTADAMKQPGLPDVAEDMMEHHRELIQLVQESDSVREILDIAYKLEEDAHYLYLREAKRAENEQERKIFEDLSRFEMGHMNLIKDLIAKNS
jgi:rubrerythrin